jgi:hypothetical protein
MKAHCAALVAGLILCLSVAVRALYEYDYSYGFDLHDEADGRDCESCNKGWWG